MTRDLWIFSLVLLNALISSSISQENEFNPEIEGYGQENFQNDAPPGMMVLPQDCFEVCNDYECLYLCPQPLRGIKRCITPLKSNKKNCCQNGQKESSSGTDNLKTAGKHIWQAREQLLGIKKELENDLANRRFSLLKGIQPLSLKQHNRDSLFKLGTKTSKPKSNNVQFVCPVTDRKMTSPPNNLVITNDAVLGGGDGENNGNRIPPKLPFYNEQELLGGDETGQISNYNDGPGEILLSTTTVPMLQNEYNEGIREQVSAPESNSVGEGKEETQSSFTDVRGGTLEAGQATYNTDLPKSSYDDYNNSPDDEQSNNENLLNQPSPFSSSYTEQHYKYNYKSTITNDGKTQTMSPNIFQSDPIMYYSDSYRSRPLEIENNVLSQNDENFSYTTPMMYARVSSDIAKPSKLETAENSEAVNVNPGEKNDYPFTEFQNPMLTTPGILLDKQSKINENILAESNYGPFTDSKNSTYIENEESFSPFTTKGSGVPRITNMEESTSLKAGLRNEKIPRENLERVLAESYLRSEDNEHQSLTQGEINKSDLNFPLSNKTGVRDEINNLNTSENFYVQGNELEGSSHKLNNTQHSYGYFNDESSSNVNEKPEMSGGATETKLSSGRDDENSLSEIQKLLSSDDNKKENYTYRMLKELFSRYNITNDIKGGVTKAPDRQPLDNSVDHEISKEYLAQERPVIKSNLTGQSADIILQNKINANTSNFVIDNTKNGQYNSNSIISRTKTEMSNNHVVNKTMEEWVQVPSSREINNAQLLSKPNDKSTRDIHNSGSQLVESTSNILKSFGINDESGESDGVTYPGENTTSEPLETITSITKDNIRNTMTVGNPNGIPLDKGATRENWTSFTSPHSQASRVEKATTPSVYLVQKGSLENSSDNDDSQLYLHADQPEKTVSHIITNGTKKNQENKNINISENQFHVESNIEGPMIQSNLKNSELDNQELLYDPGDPESPNNNSTNDGYSAKIFGTGSIDESFYNETKENNLYDQNEKVLQLIPKVSEIPPSASFDDKRTKLKNHGIEEVHLKLEESNENSSKNIERDNNDSGLYSPKNPDEISTEFKDSESYTLEDPREDSIINKEKLSDIINSELNTMKQQNVILKKREEEETSYDEDPKCDCEYGTGRDEESGRDPRPGQHTARGSTYLHPVYPLFIIVPLPYHVCDCENKTAYNNLNNNQIIPPDPYVSREHSEALPDYSFNSVYNNLQYEREQKAVRAPPYMPHLFFPFPPWGEMYTVVHPYQQVTEQRFENDFQARDTTDEIIDTTTDSNPSREGLRNPNPEDIVELHQESVSISNSSENQRFSRDESKETEADEYVFIDGQYVRVWRGKGSVVNGGAERREERLRTVTEPPIADSSTTASYIHTSQGPFPADEVVTSVAMDTNENGHRPVHYFYPGDFGTAQNRVYNYYPSFVFNHQR